MKIAKSRIRLSPFHPSLLPDIKPESTFGAPLVIDQEGTLVDGYRRYRMEQGDEMEVIQMQIDNLFEAAFKVNLRTRLWDETDCFLWTRWARALDFPALQLPYTRFREELFQADSSLLSVLADRKLSFRQAILILQAPVAHRAFFRDFLTGMVQLNTNESAHFIEMACDIRNSLGKGEIRNIFEQESLADITGNPGLSPKQKGEALLKQMRALRYPYYQRRSEEFHTYWRQLNFDRAVQVRRSLFLERGILEILVSATSFDDLNRKVTDLFESMSSPVWSKIWEG